MAREFTNGFYSSKAWIECRKGFMESKNYICNNCGGIGNIAHHKIHLNENNIDDPTITLNWDLLECLCIECHNLEHSNNRITRKGLVFDDKGNIVER